MRRLVLTLAAVSVAAMVASEAGSAAAPGSPERDRDVVRCGVRFACHGTPGPDIVRSTDVANRINARGSGDVLVGRGGDDTLRGRKGNDELRAGDGDDYLEGGRGTDALAGGPGGDAYEVDAAGWGRDSVVDSAPNSDAVPGNSLRVGYSFVGDLTVDLVSGEGPEVSDAAGTGTMDWEGDAVDDAYVFGDGDDRILGNDRANLLGSGGGEDTVRAGGGDDEVYVEDGEGGDVVSCGEDGEGVEDNDVVYSDPPDPETGDPGDVVDPDCEVEKDLEPPQIGGSSLPIGP